jgi:hypothetical protein
MNWASASPSARRLDASADPYSMWNWARREIEWICAEIP